MTIRLGDVAPDFSADTTDGPINFHEWLGDSWGILFSHPKDFTPVCTTELGAFAARKSEFDSRNTKIIGVSVDDVASHQQWKGDIAETQGTALNFPIIGDEERKVSTLYDMIHPNAKDMIIRGGENVSSVAVEAALFEHPDVADCAVIGVPHPLLGEEVATVIVVRPGRVLRAEELSRHVSHRLARFEVPTRYYFRGDPLPRNPQGKVLKRALRESLLAD